MVILWLIIATVVITVVVMIGIFLSECSLSLSLSYSFFYSILQVAANPPSEDHASALAEHSAMVDIMDACLADDPKAFTSPEFAAIRQGQRVIDGATQCLKGILASPLLDSLEVAQEEHARVAAMIDKCCEMMPSAFGSMPEVSR